LVYPVIKLPNLPAPFSFYLPTCFSQMEALLISTPLRGAWQCE
jgi:hypothetical protein